MKNFALPFELPCNLLVTQHLGTSPAHKTGNAIDLQPLISGVDKRTAVAIYLKTYVLLVSHMKRGLIRINNSDDCWHYHYYLDDRGTWAFGSEQYSYQTTTTMINGKPVKSSGCKPSGTIYESSLKDVLATTKLAVMVKNVQTFLLRKESLTGPGSLTDSAVQSYIELSLPMQSPTLVFFDETKFNESDVSRLLSNFSATGLFLPSLIWAPVSPGEIDDTKDILFWLSVAAGAYFLTREKN